MGGRPLVGGTDCQCADHQPHDFQYGNISLLTGISSPRTTPVGGTAEKRHGFPPVAAGNRKRVPIGTFDNEQGSGCPLAVGSGVRTGSKWRFERSRAGSRPDVALSIPAERPGEGGSIYSDGPPPGLTKGHPVALVSGRFLIGASSRKRSDGGDAPFDDRAAAGRIRRTASSRRRLVFQG